MQTEGLLKQSQQLAGELQTQQTRAAADQRAARAEGAAARRAQRRGGAQEPGNRAGPPRARGEGDRAGAHLEVQVRVPRQHVARAAHAAQQHPDPRPAARRQPGRQPDAEAGRVRAHHPRRRHRPAEPDQRHPRSVEDRVRHGHGRRRGDLLQQPARHASARPFRHEAENRGLSFEVEIDPEPRPQHHHRLQAPAAGAQEPAVERLQVHRAGRRAAAASSRGAGGWTRRSPGARPGAGGGRVRGLGHRHRHSAREAEDHLRGVPAGRRQHQPQVRRHRPRPRHQPRAGEPARRRDPAAQHARAWAAPSRSTCR